LKIDTRVFSLEFRFPFRIAHGMRSSTDVVYVRIQSDSSVGFGEATLPPYLPDTVQSTESFLSNAFIQNIKDNFEPDSISEELERNFPGNYPAKAALNMALWQCYASKLDITISDLLKISPNTKTPHTYTIGIGTREEMQAKLKFGLESGFEFFKLKLNGTDDQQVVNDYLSLSEYPFAVDVNQGWKDVYHAIDLAQFLQSFGCLMIEQPFHKSDLKNSLELRKHISVPLIADEACQVFSDISPLVDSFDGINIKLQKCGGISPAMKMIQEARSHNMKVLIGCMSESSAGCNAAEVLSPLCDWADLDGPWLIKNDPDMRDLFR
jgi:L-alanine-DL-glutamate epimerase-like enolase superfamily enzyme